MEGGGAGFVCTWVCAGGTVAGASSVVVVVVVVVFGGAEGAGGATWGALVGSGRGLTAGALGFGCPKTEVSAARHSATRQSGRSTRFM
jgi:hypothetical protein